jgi:hydroxymethylpyrimidine/phosphomethylpyrimidine kinase
MSRGASRGCEAVFIGGVEPGGAAGIQDITGMHPRDIHLFI